MFVAGSKSMRRQMYVWTWLSLIGLLTVSPSKAADELPGWKAKGRQGAVSAGGAEAVAAGLEILKRGGNAADSAAATILALSVTDSSGFCFGGEVPIIVYDSRRKVVEVLAGQGAAPRLATREYFAARGGIPGQGLEAAAVPAAFDAVVTLLDRYGTLRPGRGFRTDLAAARSRDASMASALGAVRCVG